MKLTTFIFIIVALAGCDPGRSAIYSTEECVGNYQPINLNGVTSSPEKFDTRHVEVTGYYYYGFEVSALSNSKGSKYEKSMLWVDLGPTIIASLEKDSVMYESLFKYRSGKKIKIRGEINADGGGHLSQYAATIKNVCYLEIYKW